METKKNKPYVLAIAIVVVALLLFAGGYAFGTLNGQKDAAERTSSPAAASTASPQSSPSASSSTAATAPAASSKDGSGAKDASSSSVAASTAQGAPAGSGAATSSIDEQGHYTGKDEVALYIHTYGHLPPNYISKTKAKKAGWVASEGNLADVLPGMSIGGSEFYNDEGLLPDAAGRTWTECDINYTSGRRGAERIVFSNDGLIFYTADHYKSFEQLY